MNDGTPQTPFSGEALYLQLQLKTTATTKKKNGTDLKVPGYAGMLVVKGRGL